MRIPQVRYPIRTELTRVLRRAASETGERAWARRRTNIAEL